MKSGFGRYSCLLALALVVAASAAPPPGAGRARGDLVVNGKRLALSHAVAVTGPDSFDPTQEAVMLLLTPDAVPQSKIDAAKSFDDIRRALDAGLAVRFRMGEGFHITFRHAVLGGKELQTSGPAQELKNIVVGPNSVSGSIAPWMGNEETIFDNTVAYSIDFTAPIARRFPVDKPVVFTAAAAKLAAGGGAPGQAFLDEKCKPVPTDAKSVEAALKEAGALPTDQDLAEMSKSEGHKVTRADFIARMADIAKAMAPLQDSDCKVLGGKMEGDVAVLQVQAKTLGSLGRTDVIMVNDGTKWKVKREGTWTALP